MTKMTKMDWFNAIATIIEASDAENKEDALAFINRETALLEKKRESSKASKANSENTVLKENMKNALVELARPVTITELQKEYAEFSEYSNQKLSALLNGMAKAGEITKTMEKKKAYFAA